MPPVRGTVFTRPRYANVTAGRCPRAARRARPTHAPAVPDRKSDEGMPTLRLALAQVNPTVGDLAGNAGIVRRLDPRGRRRRRPPGRLPGDDADRLPGRGPGVPGVVRGRVPGRAASGWPPTWPPTGSATLPVRGRLPGRRRPGRGSAPTPTPGRGPRNALAVLHGGRVVATLLQAPPAQLRRLRRGPLLRARRHADRGADRRRRRGADHLRGHVAGRRAVRGRRGGPGSGWSSTSTARRTS